MQDKHLRKFLSAVHEGDQSARRHALRIGLVAIGVIVVSAAGTYLLAPAPSGPAPNNNVAATPNTESPHNFPEAKKQYFSPLTGLVVKDEATTKRQTTAIMIENSPDARPQSGLYGAGIVYEAVAEGGITRFLAIYQEKLPGLIGPVRSVRPYYVQWLAPYKPAVAHVGGSAKALKELRNGSYKDIDQFFNPDAYYRSSDRYAPHNVYTTGKLLNELNAKKGYKSSKFDTWPRKVDAPSTKPNAKNINVVISSELYNSSYVYDAGTNSYKRSQAGSAHIDREAKKAMNPKVIVIMKVVSQPGFEDGYREQITTTGKGEAYIFQDGTVRKVTWRKQGSKAPLKFFASNKEVALNAGQTWLTAIPVSGGSVTWK